MNNKAIEEGRKICKCGETIQNNESKCIDCLGLDCPCSDCQLSAEILEEVTK